MSRYETITTETQDRVFLIGLNRPRKLNAFNLLMLRELSQAYTEYEENPDVWCAVLFAHGKHFTTGLALDEVGPAIQSGQSLFPDDMVDPLGVGEKRCTKPVICVVQGWCITIGMELLLASDIRVAAANARFTQLEVRRGIMPFGGATMRLFQLSGWGNGMRHLLTGDKFDADEAYRIGLVQEIAETGAQLDRAVAIAGEVVTAAPLAVQAALASARVALHRGEDAAAKELLPQVKTLMNTEDAEEGVTSFVERRDAVFKGK